MPKIKRRELAAEAHRRNLEQLAALGAAIRQSRQRRRLTQAEVAAGAGLSRSAVSAVERGLGGGHTVDSWQRIALAVERPLIVSLARDAEDEPADGGHLAIQDLVLRLGKAAGYRVRFELATRPIDIRRSADVVLIDDTRCVAVLVECWNKLTDIGAAARSTDRKLAELESLARGWWEAGHPLVVGACWVLRDTRGNRGLVKRYAAVFDTRFPGSSRHWVAAISGQQRPPGEPGLVWCSLDATRLFPWRRRIDG